MVLLPGCACCICAWPDPPDSVEIDVVAPAAEGSVSVVKNRGGFPSRTISASINAPQITGTFTVPFTSEPFRFSQVTQLQVFNGIVIPYIVDYRIQRNVTFNIVDPSLNDGNDPPPGETYSASDMNQTIKRDHQIVLRKSCLVSENVFETKVAFNGAESVTFGQQAFRGGWRIDTSGPTPSPLVCPVVLTVNYEVGFRVPNFDETYTNETLSGMSSVGNVSVMKIYRLQAEITVEAVRYVYGSTSVPFF